MLSLKKTILYLALLAAICIICFRSVSQSPKPKEPKYRYFLRHEDPRRYYSAVDTMNIITGMTGRTMTRDNSEYWLVIATRNLQILYKEARLDSVLIK